MGCFDGESDKRHEPTAERGCTDVCWLVIFSIFSLALVVVGIFSFVYGNPLRVINGYDSFGNTCGVKSNDKYKEFPLSGINTVDKPYVFFLDIKELRQSLKICVKSCPDQMLSTGTELYRYYTETNNKLCRYDFNMTDLQVTTYDQAKFFHLLGPCPVLPVYQETPILHRCIPTGKNAPAKEVRQLYSLLNSWDIAEQLLSDLYKTWHLIAMFCVLALLLSVVLITLLHWLTKVISWLICIVVGVVSIALTVILWTTYYRIKHGMDSHIKYSQLEELTRNETAIYVLAIIATIVMVFLIVIIFLLRTKIGGLAALFEEAGKCMLSLPGLFGPPILAFIALILFFAFWLTVIICLATANYPNVHSLLSETDNKMPTIAPTGTTEAPLKNVSGIVSAYKSFKLVEYVDAVWLKRMLWFYVVGLIWTSEFIFACQQLTIAGAVAYWYFRKPTDSPVLHAIAKLVKYHLGSVAKGSFLITIFKIPRLILTYLYAKLKRGESDGSGCATCGLKFCICCFYFLEKFIRYMNHNTYTVIAIESINFCSAAGIAWNALMSNALQVATINGIGDFILFLGKVAVAAVCGLISILLLRDNDDVNFYVAPVLVVTVFAFFIAHVILSLYEIVVDTLFLCVCEDRTINGPNGRWKESNLAMLLGEVPVVEESMQRVEMTPITKQPFSYKNQSTAVNDQ